MKFPRKMTLNVIIDSLAFAGFVFLMGTGVLMRYILPPGSGHYSSIWGLDRHEWGAIHYWIALILSGILALHLFLHWKWIISVFKRKPSESSRSRFLLGLIGLLTVVALALAPLVSPVIVDEERGERHMEPSGTGSGKAENALDFEDVPIRGSMTLREVSQNTGVPVGYILDPLGLPEDTPEEEQLGRLSNQHGFDIAEVRRIITEYKRE